MGALPHVIEIVFEVQMKMSIEKNNKERKKLSNLENASYYFFLFGPFLLSKLLTFSLFFSF
jgi:hypothetical protein